MFSISFLTFVFLFFFFSSRRRHTRCALVTGVQTCALPICLEGLASGPAIIARHGASLTELPGEHPAWSIQADYLGQLCAQITLEIGRASCRERVCQYV